MTKETQQADGLTSHLTQELDVDTAMITIKERIDALCLEYGSLRNTSKIIDVDFGYLSGLRSGTKTNPSDNTLEKLGLKKVVTYVLK